jgi:hypothetical protein
MEDVVLCFIYYPHSGYVTFSSVYRLKKAIRIILRWHAFGQNSFSLEWDFTIKSKSQVLEPDKVI